MPKFKEGDLIIRNGDRIREVLSVDTEYLLRKLVPNSSEVFTLPIDWVEERYILLDEMKKAELV